MAASNEIIRELSLGGTVRYIPNFLDKVLSDKLLEELLGHHVNWDVEIFKMFGKEVPSPRILSAMIDEGFCIEMDPKYNGKKAPGWVDRAVTWTPKAKDLKDVIERTTGKSFHYAELNHYTDGKDYIGWHTDKEMKEMDVVASISLGATRRMCFRRYKDEEGKVVKSGSPEFELNLEHGSLCIFDHGAGCANYKHTIPKVRKKDNYQGWKLEELGEVGRVNMTFRM